MNLIDLPDLIKNNIIKYLPQQALINLSLTNYKFYKPCQRQLYKNITIMVNPPLRCKLKRELDFQDSTQTMIYGYESFRNKQTNLSMVYARIMILIQSLTINVELIGYIQLICVIGDLQKDFNDNDDIVTALVKLVGILQELDRFYISDYKLRQKLDLSKLRLKSWIVDDITELSNDPKITELLIGENKVMKNFDEFASKLTSLILPDDANKYWDWISTNLFNSNNKNDLILPNVTRFKFVFNFDMSLNARLLKLINWNQLKELELIFGYKDINDDDYVIDCLNMIPRTPNLKKLSIIQGQLYPTHEQNELFDLNIFTFLEHLLAIADLKYLSIKHNVHPLGNLPDGMDGYYKRRWNLFMIVLPKIINNHNIILVLPNLFQTFAGYEQHMNTVLWIGCKCPHCKIYLELIDEFLLYHKYYDKDSKRYKDLNVLHLFSEIGQQLNLRMIQDELLTQMNHLSFPLINHLWDFHSNTNNRPFKCYDIQTVDQGEYDDDNYDPKIPIRCLFNQQVYKGIPESMSHYVNTLVTKLINLDRGDAEARDVNEFFNDGGDIEYKINLKKLIINGFNYIIDRETNGTHFYENVYD